MSRSKFRPKWRNPKRPGRWWFKANVWSPLRQNFRQYFGHVLKGEVDAMEPRERVPRDFWD